MIKKTLVEEDAMKLVKLLIFFSSGHYIKIVSWLLFGQNRNRTELISATWPLGKWEYENKKMRQTEENSQRNAAEKK